MKKETKPATIILNFTYMVIQGSEVVFVQIKSIPQFEKKVKWALLGDSLHYDYEEFRKMLSEIPFKRGSVFKLYIINEETGLIEPIRLDISKDWPTDLTAGKVLDAPIIVDISRQMEKLRLL